MSDIKKYIEQLDISSGNRNFSFENYASSELESDGPESVINFKGIQSFAGDLSPSKREDVLNSMLLAQRAATKQFPDEADIIKWHQLYFDVLSNLGWSFVSKDFQNYDFKGNAIELEKTILDILAAIIPGNQLAIIQAALKALKSLGDDDKRLIAFETNTHSDQKGNFQIGFANEENGVVSIMSSAFILNTTKRVKRILFFSSESESANLEYCTIKASLNEKKFSEGRDILRQKLGDVSSFIAALDI